ncbi:MAG: translation initiation factor IF-2, partial [Smithella sp.]
EVVQGRAEVRELFRVPKVGIIAGCHVTDGKITRTAGIKLVRDSVAVFDGKILSLKRFKDDAREVLAGFDCGIGIESYNDIHVGDVIESYITETLERKL